VSTQNFPDNPYFPIATTQLAASLKEIANYGGNCLRQYLKETPFGTAGVA
jgi:hypothetical protein